MLSFVCLVISLCCCLISVSLFCSFFFNLQTCRHQTAAAATTQRRNRRRSTSKFWGIFFLCHATKHVLIATREVRPTSIRPSVLSLVFLVLENCKCANTRLCKYYLTDLVVFFLIFAGEVSLHPNVSSLSQWLHSRQKKLNSLRVEATK